MHIRCVCSWACASYDFKTFSGRFKIHPHAHGTILEKWRMRSTCSMRIRIACAGRIKCTCVLYAKRMHCACSWACASYAFKTFYDRFKVDAHSHGTFLEKWGMPSTCSMRIRIARAGRLKCALYIMCIH